jgi:glycine cleavage system H protein
VTPDDLRYTAEHAWVRPTGADTVRIGITDYAQDRLGDIVEVSLPKVGGLTSAGTPYGDVESTKSVSDLVAPITGEVLAVNTDLVTKPELVNSDPYGSGWLLDLRVEGPLEAALADLLDVAGYRVSADI